MNSVIHDIIEAVTDKSSDLQKGVGAVRTLIADSDLAFVSRECGLDFLLSEARSGREGAWVSLLHLAQNEYDYEQLLEVSPFRGKKVLFAVRDRFLTIQGGEGVMFDQQGVMRNPIRVKAQFGNSAIRSLYAWVYDPL